MTYCRRPSSQAPQRRQYVVSNSRAILVGAVGAIGIAAESKPRARRAPVTNFLHRFMPLMLRSADMNDINRTVTPSASCACISQPLPKGAAKKHNAAHAIKPRVNAAHIGRFEHYAKSSVVKNLFHDCRSELKCSH